MKNTHKILFTFLLSILIMACSEDEENLLTNPNEGLVEVTSVNVPDSDFQLKMFVQEGQSLEVGYNQFALAVFDDAGQYMKNVHLSASPMMQMMEMAHSAPSETYEHSMGGDAYQNFAVVFVMPSGEMGSWKLEVDIHDMDTDFTAEVSLPVTIENPEESRMKSINVSETEKLFVSLVRPSEPSVGSNDFEISIHRRESMMSWPAMTDYTIEIEPEMPAMGHGSPNNVNPVHDQMGHYMGEVNFTMTGEWLVHVTINSGSDLIAETDFTITF